MCNYLCVILVSDVVFYMEHIWGNYFWKLLQSDWPSKKWYQVSEKSAQDWCAANGNIPYFETSAKEDYNVDAAFLSVAKLALDHERNQDM